MRMQMDLIHYFLFRQILKEVEKFCAIHLRTRKGNLLCGVLEQTLLHEALKKNANVAK